MFDFSDKTAVVTGAAAGIGNGAARGLADCGAHVVACDIDESGLRKLEAELTAAGLSCTTVRADVTVTADIERLVAVAASDGGGIDVLVTAAGGFPRVVAVDEITDDEWDAGLTLNLTSVFRCCRAVVPYMKGRSAGGRIVTVSSAAGRMPATATSAYYAASKAGILGLTRHLARELAPHQITVNAVAPGTTKTPRLEAMYSEAHFAAISRLTPLGRVGEVADQIGPILFLASDAARYITGATLDVNGGKVML